MDSNSDAFKEKLRGDIVSARGRAKKNIVWAEGHTMVNAQTGEVVTNEEGEPLTLADMSKSWYSNAGARNNSFSIVKRLKRALDFSCDLKKHRPKLITLTFADLAESWETKRTVQKFLDSLRHWAKRQGLEVFPYFWSAEVQTKSGRDALHYHILVLGLPFLTKEQVRAWWPYGFVDIRAADDTGRAFKYMAKYLWKWGKLAAEPDELPDWWYLFSVFSKRRYGFSKWFTLPPVERIPRWLKEGLQDSNALDQVIKASRVEGGGWLVCLQRPDLVVKLRFPSPFRVVSWANEAKRSD